jgi:glycosyltransferase involved in cell wall biosynthesis
MKIILDTVPLIHSGGAERRTAFHLYRELLTLDRDDEFGLLCIDRFQRRGKCTPLLAIRDMPVREVHLPFRVLEWGWKYLRWPTVESLLGPVDVYHVACTHAPPARRATVLLTVRGIAAEVIPDLLPPDRVKLQRAALRTSMRHAHYFLAVSESTRNDMVKCLGVDPKRIFVVNHGVDPIFRPPTDRSALAARLRARFGITRPYLLYVGWIGHHKNVMGLLCAFQALHARGLTDYDLWLVGGRDSAWDDAQDFVQQHNLLGRVHLPGMMDQDSQDLTDLYGGASCCVFPSFYEGWCSPPTEAMACGAPVVASSRSSLPETVGEAALLTDPDDPERIAQDVAAVLTDGKLRQALVRKGLERAAQLSWSESAWRLIGIYRQIERARA